VSMSLPHGVDLTCDPCVSDPKPFKSLEDSFDAMVERYGKFKKLCPVRALPARAVMCGKQP
jgi:hypothetical protein